MMLLVSGRRGVMAAKTTAWDTTAEIAFLTRALKSPTLRESVPRLAERAPKGDFYRLKDRDPRGRVPAAATTDDQQPAQSARGQFSDAARGPAAASERDGSCSLALCSKI